MAGVLADPCAPQRLGPVERPRAYPVPVTSLTLEFTREFDLPRAIVWDALVEPVLLEGWLADAEVEPRVGGRFRLRWVEPDHLSPFSGEIVTLVPRELLDVEGAASERLRFSLRELPGGTRGTSSSLSIAVTSVIEPPFAPGVIAHWQSSLDQLEDLLRGRPVDWANWERDRRASWGDHFDRAARGERH